MKTDDMVPYGYRMTELGLLPEEWGVPAKPEQENRKSIVMKEERNLLA